MRGVRKRGARPRGGHSRAALLGLALALFAAGCDHRIVVPLRGCVVEGTQVTAAPGPGPDVSCPVPGACFYTRPLQKIDDAWNSLVDQVNAIWAPAANLAFLGCCQEVPVIPDPQFRAAPLDIGQVQYANDHRPSDEMASLVTECIGAWASKSSPVDEGLVVLLAADVVGPGATHQGDLGITVTLPLTIDLCQEPRGLPASIVAASYSVVPEPAAFGGSNGLAGDPALTLAHELGHALGLFHGDGLDNDGNGAQPPAAGPRLFDSRCDDAEYQRYDLDPSSASVSLMTAAQYGSRLLTPLQVELAREVALALPGHVGGP